MSNATVENICIIIYVYLAEIGLLWSKRVGLSVYGKINRLAVRIKQIVLKCDIIHCIIHHGVSASNNMPPNLESVLNDAVKLISFIKARTLNSRLFTIFLMPKYWTIKKHQFNNVQIYYY